MGGYNNNPITGCSQPAQCRLVFLLFFFFSLSLSLFFLFILSGMGVCMNKVKSLSAVTSPGWVEGSDNGESEGYHNKV